MISMSVWHRGTRHWKIADMMRWSELDRLNMRIYPHKGNSVRRCQAALQDKHLPLLFGILSKCPLGKTLTTLKMRTSRTTCTELSVTRPMTEKRTQNRSSRHQPS